MSGFGLANFVNAERFSITILCPEIRTPWFVNSAKFRDKFSGLIPRQDASVRFSNGNSMRPFLSWMVPVRKIQFANRSALERSLISLSVRTEW